MMVWERMSASQATPWGQVHQTDVNLMSYNENIGREYIRRFKILYSVCTIATWDGRIHVGRLWILRFSFGY